MHVDEAQSTALESMSFDEVQDLGILGHGRCRQRPQVCDTPLIA